MQIDDAQLVAAALAGNTEAFAALVRRYRDAVYGLAYHYVADTATAEDLAQDALVQGYARLHELRDPDKFAPWLMAIARNLCRQRLRRPQPVLAEADVEPTAPGPERQVVEHDVVHRALSALPPDNGLAVTLFYVNGYSYADIAQLLQAPVSTVKGRIERGRRHLREEMIGMMRDQLGARKPGEEMTGTVIRRISAAEVWALPRRARSKHLGDPFVLIDGELAHLTAGGSAGSGALVASAGLDSADGRPFCVFQVLHNPNRYYIFGQGRVGADGQVVGNRLVQTALRLTPGSKEALVTEPWEPERVSSQELWALPAEPRQARLAELHHRSRGGIINLDGHLACMRCTVATTEAGTVSDGCEVSIVNRGPGPMDVYRGGGPAVKYYVFGDALATPPGLRVMDGFLTLQAVVTGPVCGQGGGPGRRLPEFSSQELWELGREAQIEALAPYLAVRIDGEVCVVKLTGGTGTTLRASATIAATKQPGLAYQTVGRDRFCIFGQVEVPALGARLENQAVDTGLTVAVVPESETGPSPTPFPELQTAPLCAGSVAERERLLGRASGHGQIILDGNLTDVRLLNGPPGASCTSPGGEVTFTNVGGRRLTVFRWEDPEPNYFVFGEAEVTPPGLLASDAIVILEATTGQ